MKKKPLTAVIIGFGKIAAGYVKDSLMSQHYNYSTHAQVLSDHPQFEWIGIVEPNATVASRAQSEWNIANVFSSVEELTKHLSPDVAILATPPQERLSIVKALPSLKGILVEKPLSLTVSEAYAFTDYCQQKSITAAINFWRRTDELFERLQQGLLFELIGKVQAIFGVYGNGLVNNASHLIDFIRFICGDIEAIQSVPKNYPNYKTPIPSDNHLAFNLLLKDAIAHFQPINFTHYRECGIDFWGETGKLSIVQEGLKMLHFPRKQNRATQDCFEIANDQPNEIATTVGHALYHMYSNLADAILENTPLKSHLTEGLKNIQIINAIQHSQGKLIPLEPEAVLHEL